MCLELTKNFEISLNDLLLVVNEVILALDYVLYLGDLVCLVLDD
jgi:hypothetical protein